MINNNIYALLIGIGDYKKIKISDLPSYRMDVALIGTFISYFEKLIGRKPHIVEAKSAVSRNAWGGHSSTAPLLLLSKRHPLRWAAVWGRLRRLTPA